jgi:hypothetical protein
MRIGLALPCGQKLALGLQATITLEVVPFVLSALPFFKCILEVVFCVFSIACDSASITTTVSKWMPFTFILNWETERYGGWGTTVIVFSKKFPGEKGSVRRYIVAMRQPVLLSPKFGAKSSHTFAQSP